MTVEEILADLGVTVDPAKAASVAKWNTTLATTESGAAQKLAAAEKQLQDAQALQRVIDENIRTAGLTETNMAQLQASNAALTAALASREAAIKAIKDQGFTNLNIPDLPAVNTPAPKDPVAEANERINNLTKGDPVAQIKELRHQRGLPLGEEPMDGVEVGIDAVGFQARDRSNPDVENPTQVISDLARLVNPTGHLGIAGVYAEKDLHPAPEGTGDGHLEVPWATLFSKGVSVGFGRTHDRRYTVLLRDMVTSGRARPSFVVTHHGGLEDAPRFFSEFDQRADGVIKAVLRP